MSQLASDDIVEARIKAAPRAINDVREARTLDFFGGAERDRTADLLNKHQMFQPNRFFVALGSIFFVVASL